MLAEQRCEPRRKERSATEREREKNASLSSCSRANAFSFSQCTIAIASMIFMQCIERNENERCYSTRRCSAIFLAAAAAAVFFIFLSRGPRSTRADRRISLSLVAHTRLRFTCLTPCAFCALFFHRINAAIFFLHFGEAISMGLPCKCAVIFILRDAPRCACQTRSRSSVNEPMHDWPLLLPLLLVAAFPLRFLLLALAKVTAVCAGAAVCARCAPHVDGIR